MHTKTNLPKKIVVVKVMFLTNQCKSCGVKEFSSGLLGRGILGVVLQANSMPFFLKYL
jgi:hypothetical protein